MSRRPGEGDETREKILNAALPLFAASGFAATTTRAVARDAGVNVATLAYHFGDKQGLYDNVVQRLHEDLAMLSTDRPPEDSPQRFLRGWILDLWAFARSHRQHVRLLVRHVLDHGDLPSVVVERWNDRFHDLADPLLADLRPDWTRTDRRLFLASQSFVFARLAMEDDLALRRLIPDADDRDAAVGEWLVARITEALGLGVAPSRT